MRVVSIFPSIALKNSKYCFFFIYIYFSITIPLNSVKNMLYLTLKVRWNLRGICGTWGCEKSKALDNLSELLYILQSSVYQEEILLCNWNRENVQYIFSVSFSSIHFSVFHLFLPTASRNLFYSNMHPAFILLLPCWLILVAQCQKRPRVIFPNARPGSWMWATSWHVHTHAVTPTCTNTQEAAEERWRWRI